MLPLRTSCIQRFLVLCVLINFGVLSSNSNESSTQFTSTAASTILESTTEAISSNFVLERDLSSFVTDEFNDLTIAHNLRSRGKRSKYYHSGYLTDNIGAYHLNAVEPIFSVCPGSPDVRMVKFFESIATLCVHKNATAVLLGRLSLHDWSFSEIAHFPAGNVQDIAFFTDASILYILIADSHRYDGIDLIRIDKNFRLLQKEHTINSQHPTSLSIWKPKFDNKWHLAIANSPKVEGKNSFRSVTNTYVWLGTYFDQYAPLQSFYVKDIVPFTIGSSDYLAIINYQASKAHHQVDSEVFKLDIDKKKWLSVQLIRTFAASDGEFFSLGARSDEEEHFLAIANEYDVSNGRRVYDVNSVIYKFSSDKFLPFQCLKTIGATSISAYKGTKGEFVLALGTRHGVKLYQYNGWKFVESYVQRSSGPMALPINSLFSTHVLKDSVLLVNSIHNYGQRSVYRLGFYYENALGAWHNRSLAWCRSTLDQTKGDFYEQIAPEFDNIAYINQQTPIRIAGDLVLSNEAQVRESMAAPTIEDRRQRSMYSDSIVKQMDNMHNALEKLQNRLHEAEQLMSSALRLYGDQVVTAPYKFRDVLLNCTSCMFGSIDAKTVNNINVANIANEIIDVNSKEILPLKLRLQAAHVLGDVTLNGLINGFSSSQIITKTGTHHIPGTTYFKSEIFCNDAYVRGLVNERPLNKGEILLNTGDQNIFSHIEFVSKFAMQNLHATFLNGRNLNKVLSNIVTLEGKYVVHGHKQFNHLHLEQLEMMPNATINGINMVDHWQNAMWTHEPQSVRSPMSFSHLHMRGQLTVHGLINGVKIPNPTMVFTNRDATVAAPKRFSTSVVIQDMIARDLINGVHFSDIMLKNVPQKIPASKTFDHLHLGGHSDVTGTVDEIKLSELLRLALLKNESQRLTGSWTVAGDAVFHRGVSVRGLVGGVPLQNLYQHALRVTDKELPRFLYLYFRHLNAPSLKAEKVNGLNLERDLVIVDRKQTINGLKHFHGGLIAKRSVFAYFINGYDARALNDLLLHHERQSITTHKVVLGDLVVNDLLLDRINGVDLDDLLLLKANQTVHGSYVLKSPKVDNNLFALRLDELQSINGLPMGDLFGNTLKYRGQQTVTGHKYFTEIIVPKGANVDTKNINGVNIVRVANDAVYSNRPTLIKGRKTFVAPVQTRSLEFKALLDTVSEREMLTSWLMRGVNQTIHGSLIFESIKVGQHLMLKDGKISGVNLRRLVNDVVKLDEPTAVGAPVTFAAKALSTKNVDLIGRVNGVDLSREAVLKKSRIQHIHGKKHFIRGLVVHKPLRVSGLLDNVVISDLCTNIVRKNKNQIILAPVTVVGNVTIRALRTSEGVNGVDLQLLSKNLVYKHQSAFLRGRKHFHHLVLDGPAALRGSLKGLNLTWFAMTYLSKSRDQKVFAHIKFVKGVSFKNLNALRSFWSSTGFVNNISLNALDKYTLKNLGDQYIPSPITFLNDIHINSSVFISSDTINGLQLHKDFMMKNQSNIVSAPKVFLRDLSVHSNADVLVGKTINGIDVSSRVHYSIPTDNGAVSIKGTKSFNSLEVDNLFIYGPLNDLYFHEDNLVLSNKDQTLRGRTRFTDNVDFLGNVYVDGRVNKVNLKELLENLVLKGKNNTIYSEKSVISPISAKSMVALNTVDGANVNEIDAYVRRPLDLSSVRAKLDRQKRELNSLSTYLSHSQQYHYYEKLLKVDGALIPVVSKAIHNLLYFKKYSLANGCSKVQVYMFDGHTYKGIQQITSYDPIAVLEFSLREKFYVAIFNKKTVEPQLAANCLSLKTSYGKSALQIFSYNKIDYKLQLIHNVLYGHISDIQSIPTDKEEACFVAIVEKVSKVLCMKHDGTLFEKMKLLTAVKNPNAVFAGKRGTGKTPIALYSHNGRGVTVEIFEWSSKQQILMSLQTLVAFKPARVLICEAKKHSTSFLFVAEAACPESGRKSLLRVFQQSDDHKAFFKEVQQIRENVKHMETVDIANENLVVLILTEHSIKLYRLEGSSGFSLLDTLHVGDATKYTTNMIEKSGIAGHHLTVSYGSRHSYILEAKLRTALIN